MKVVVADTMMVQLSNVLRSAVESDIDWVFCEHFVEAELCRLLTDAHVYIGTRFTTAMAKAAQSLQFIQVSGAGVNGIAFDTLRPDVIVANTYHHERSIAEYVITAMIVLSRQLFRNTAKVTPTTRSAASVATVLAIRRAACETV